MNKYQRVYRLLKAIGHSAAKAAEITIDAIRGNPNAMTWVYIAFQERRLERRLANALARMESKEDVIADHVGPRSKVRNNSRLAAPSWPHGNTLIAGIATRAICRACARRRCRNIGLR